MRARARATTSSVWSESPRADPFPGAAIPTAPPAGVDGEGADVDGTPLSAWPDAFPLAFEDPLFGASRPAPTTVVQWSKG